LTAWIFYTICHPRGGNPSNQINFSIIEREQGIAKIKDEMEL